MNPWATRAFSWATIFSVRVAKSMFNVYKFTLIKMHDIICIYTVYKNNREFIVLVHAVVRGWSIITHWLSEPCRSS